MKQPALVRVLFTLQNELSYIAKIRIQHLCHIRTSTKIYTLSVPSALLS